MNTLQIIEATEEHLSVLALLFDNYRVFYEQQPDLKASTQFLKNRMDASESVVFMALTPEKKAVGFIQLYPIFSSVSLESFYILNDFFVNLSFRNQGIGEALLKKAIEFSTLKKSKGLALETAIDNPAQQLYERLGWKKDSNFLHYFRAT